MSSMATPIYLFPLEKIDDTWTVPINLGKEVHSVSKWKLGTLCNKR